MQGLRPLSRYFDFRGRSGRAEYWQWFALSTGCGWIVQALQATAEPTFGTPASLMVPIYAAATIIPQCSVTTRRLHDRGRPGWLYGILIVILCLAVGLLVYGRIMIDQTADDTHFIGGLIVMGVAIVGAAACLIECARPGNAGPNKYGPPDNLAGPHVPPSDADGSLTVRAHSPAAPSYTRPPADLVGQLDKLDALRERGALSDIEYEKAKTRVLDDAASPLPSSIVTASAPASLLETGRNEPAPNDWQPKSKTWQKRFAFYDRYGLAESSEQREALQALAASERYRLKYSFLALVFGPFYYLYLGLWRVALVLLAAVVGTSLLIDPVVEYLLPGRTEDPLGRYQVSCTALFAIFYSASVIPLYYMQQRYGVRTWNPFRRSIVND